MLWVIVGISSKTVHQSCVTSMKMVLRVLVQVIEICVCLDVRHECEIPLYVQISMRSMR